MENKEIIGNFEKAIINIYCEKELTCIRGLNGDFIHYGIQIYQYFYTIFGKIEEKSEIDIDYRTVLDDLVIFSDEILYFTAILYFHRPYINNPLKNEVVSGGKKFYPNKQNVFAQRYNMYLDVVYQCLYNYWDRIGDIIASVFPNSLNKHEINFAKTLDTIPITLKESDNAKWLYNFKRNQYKEFNSTRKNIVHYVSSNTTFNNAHLENVDNKNRISELMTEREKYPDFFNRQIQFTIEGLIKVLNLFDEYNMTKS